MTQVLLDDSNCDLNFNIRPDGLAGHSFSHNGWQYMWAGVRATHGVLRGRVFYEVHVINQYKLNEYLEGCDVKSDCNIRVGWSHDHTDLLVSEDINSYGYDGSGFKGSDGRFDVYGDRIHIHDVVTCYLDLDSGLVSFQKNSQFLGTAFKLEKRAKDKAYFPHICTKNTEVFVNFGQKPPAFKPPPGFIFISHTHPNNLQYTPRPSSKPQNFELIMMIGLPGCGKTTYAKKQVKENLDKRYYCLGQDMIMGHLRNAAVKRYKLKWNRVVKLASDIATEQIKEAGMKLRNYIIDQTNVYAEPRRNKLHLFDGYKTIAAVLVVTDSELIKRCKEREQVSPKHIPLPAVDEMKKNFTLPHEDEGLFSEIRYVEQTRSIAEAIMSSYKTTREMNNKPGILSMRVISPTLPGFRTPYPMHPGARHLGAFIPGPPRYTHPSRTVRHDNKNRADMFNNKRDDQVQIENLAKSVDNIRMKEPDQSEIMRAVKRVQPSQQHYKKNDQHVQNKPTVPYKAFETNTATINPEEEKPEQKEKKEEKPEQIVHPIQQSSSMQYIKEQHPSPHIIPPDTLHHHVYMPGMTDKEQGARPGIIPMSKINDHTMFNNQQHLVSSQHHVYNAGNQTSTLFSQRAINMAGLQFPRSQTPVTSYTSSSLGSLSTPNFNQNSLSNTFNSNQQFISQPMTNQEQLLSLATFQQNHPFQQMVVPQNYQMGALELMPQAIHSAQTLHSTPGLHTQLLQQNSISDPFPGLAGSHGYPARYNIQKPKQFGR